MDKYDPPKYVSLNPPNTRTVTISPGSLCLPPQDEISAFVQQMYDDIRSLEKRVDCIEGQIRDIENHVDLSDY